MFKANLCALIYQRQIAWAKLHAYNYFCQLIFFSVGDIAQGGNRNLIQKLSVALPQIVINRANFHSLTQPFSLSTQAKSVQLISMCNSLRHK